MSSRNFRKKNQKNITSPPREESDEEYEPLYAQNPGVSKYNGLEVVSQSESDRASERSEDDGAAAALPTSVSYKKKNNKKKNKGKNRMASAFELDEIERSIQEVNAILGSPPPAPAPPVNKALEILFVDPKHLNVANELRKLFGPEDGNRRARASNRALLLKRVLVHPNKDNPVYDFNNTGLSMMKQKEEGDRMYFVFNHNEAYQKMHRNFLLRLAVARGTGDVVMNFDQARQSMHVEALLEISDRLFRMEENGIGNEIVENVVTFLQYVAHPLFILSQNNVRLDYKFLENRPFHVAMLKYIYLLTNKACHRTALEIAKMMLLVDPNDPLALLSLVDILALRCREHEWLIDAIKYFDRQREAGLLFNIMYSNSLAHFHVALKNKVDLAEADRLIRNALLAFPNIFIKILECCHVSNPELAHHPIFKPDPKSSWSAGASEVFMIYAKMTSPRWNEPVVMDWLIKNATELCKNYNKDQAVRNSAEEWGKSRSTLYKVWPVEYLRHISVFSSMSKLIIDTELTAPSFTRRTCAWDPLFDKSINRYSYSYEYEPPGPPPAGLGANGSPVFSANLTNDYFRMIVEFSLRTGCYPFIYLTTEEARELNEARVRSGAPIADERVLGNRGVFFLPPEMNDNPPRMNPDGTYAQPEYVPGFNLPVPNWNVNFLSIVVPPSYNVGPQPNGMWVPNVPNGVWVPNGMWAPNGGHQPYGQQPDHWQRINGAQRLNVAQLPAPNLDWNFIEDDDEFPPYDYADDEKNFARDALEMAQAIGGHASEEDMVNQLAAAINASNIEERMRNPFRPTNAYMF